MSVPTNSPTIDHPLVGRDVTLWAYRTGLNAYRDQFGIWHPGFSVYHELEVTITEVRTDVPGTPEGVKFEGLRAVSPDGGVLVRGWNQYVRAWPAARWHFELTGPASQNGMWFEDACELYGPRQAYVDTNYQRKVPAGAEVCATHDRAYRRDDPNGCPGCAEQNRATAVVPGEHSTAR